VAQAIYTRGTIVAAITIAAAMAMPQLLRAPTPDHEASTIEALRAISSAESTYAATCASTGYAADLADLAQPPSGSTSGFVSPDLNKNGVQRSGYIITVSADIGAVPVTVAANTCNGSSGDAMSSYFAEAHPVTVGAASQRSFATDSRGTIYFLNTGEAIAPGMAGASILR
jgi:hypothetical protein